MSQIDHTHAPSADHLDDFEAPDFPADKLFASRGIFIVTLIGLHKRIEQSINFLKVPYLLSDLMLELGVLFDKFVYIRLPASQPRIDKLLHNLVKGALLIVVI
jgi:hypothetical protein